MSENNGKKLYKVKKSSIHNKGVFAACDIPEGTRIIEYIGEKITKAESDRRGVALFEESQKTGGGAVYIFTLNKRYDIDGNVKENKARFINHSCDPNCESQVKRGHIWIVSTRDIKKGEELSYDYGYDLEHFLEHPCHCGSKDCVGYIVAWDKRKKLKKILRKMKKEEKTEKKSQKKKKRK